MYAFMEQREWLKQLCEAMQTESVYADEITGPDKKMRQRVRRSYQMHGLPDRLGRLIQMTNDHKMALICFLMHIGDVGAKTSSCFVTVETVAEAVGCSNTKAEDLIRQLRAVGLIARRSRPTTSTQTFLYRAPGTWEQQAIDECGAAVQVSEPGRDASTLVKNEGPKPGRIGKAAAAEAGIDAAAQNWIEAVREQLRDPQCQGCQWYHVPSLEGAYNFGSKTAADQAIAFLKQELHEAKRIGRAVTEDGGWYVVALLRPETIASAALSNFYQREVTVDRLPQSEGVALFGVSCTMLQLFDPDTQLHRQYNGLFGPGLRNPAGQLVAKLGRIVRTSVATDKGFPFPIKPQALQGSRLGDASEPGALSSGLADTAQIAEEHENQSGRPQDGSCATHGFNYESDGGENDE